MAVTKRVFEVCKNYFQDSTKKIAELGSQYVMEGDWGSYGPPYFKEVFSNLDITSFDYVPEGGSRFLNLSEPLPNIYRGQFDLVTNFGTTEHVKDQYTCWKNIFDMIKPGGIIISEIPKKNNWAGHCKYYFDISTFYSMNLDFEILELKNIFYEGQGDLIYSVMRKIHSDEFKTKEYDLIENIQIIDSYQDPQGY